MLLRKLLKCCKLNKEKLKYMMQERDGREFYAML
jgi:hypothetical protein